MPGPPPTNHTTHTLSPAGRIACRPPALSCIVILAQTNEGADAPGRRVGEPPRQHIAGVKPSTEVTRCCAAPTVPFATLDQLAIPPTTNKASIRKKQKEQGTAKNQTNASSRDKQPQLRSNTSLRVARAGQSIIAGIPTWAPGALTNG